MTSVRIDPPACDWNAMPLKDKRKGFFWLCKTCGFKTTGRAQPICQCKPIFVAGEARNHDHNI